LRYVPDIITWVIALALASIMLRRGGGRAEKLLLAGCVIFLLADLSRITFAELLIPYAQEHGLAFQTISWFNIPTALFGLAGLVLLVIAFWIKFRRKRQGAA
jgi:LPXTG-motif cell wall-anchored protein